MRVRTAGRLAIIHVKRKREKLTSVSGAKNNTDSFRHDDEGEVLMGAQKTSRRSQTGNYLHA